MITSEMNLTRRRFVQGLGAVGIGTAIFQPSYATNNIANTEIGTAPVLTGQYFELVIDETLVNFTGKPRLATTINGSIPGPTLRWKQGDTVTIKIKNRLKTSTSIHWHGIILPYQMDGVPGISFDGIGAGQEFTYTFKVQQSGTYWYHSHSGFQEQTGMYGAIIIDPAEGESIKADRDYIIQLSDWTDEDPMDVFHKLKKQSDYFNMHKPTLGDFINEAQQKGLGQTVKDRQMWNEMRMSPTDLADVSSMTYTYLMNGQPPAANWTGLFKKGERVRLRFISSGTQSIFDVRIPGLKMTVVQVDGIDVEPVTVDEFRFGSGETYDVIVMPSSEQAYTIFSQTIGRSGFTRGTLTPHPEMTASVPDVDPPQWLTMADMMGAMMHDMTSMDHTMHQAMAANAPVVRHASTEFGPSVDMRVDTPRTNLDDPGVGLRNNGRKVLTYADLHSLDRYFEDKREPKREIELHLTGNMERYTWSFDGLSFADSSPIHFRYNERLKVTLHNDTMMTHPMHLHGMWSDLLDEQQQVINRQHTIMVQPAQRVSFLVTADALGQWAWHCHLMYHMKAGMFRQVVVS
ncbi:copper resistance system multicopper oxidase [Methylophaga sp. OBS3]|uniref:copper resistance system multicopper oxidase n=1 Tax=Methylophaga sp. OBS3 TaxID=2991934 RepID=UPI0022512331|nr:copper resistance system multicopper oxidase [Methylophaga sp. OBS3]MCX4190837.1 copper resistance system multicopper oxidase [Methylophaga sp. OBS3]